MTATGSHHPRLTADTKKFIDDLEAQKAPPLYTLSHEEAREVLNDAQSGKTARPDADIEDTVLEAGPTGSVDVRIIRPKDKSGTLPVIFYFHGGGWVMGNKKTHDRLIRTLAHETGAAVAFINYTPSPEAQFPVPIEQAYAAVELMMANAADFGFDHERFALAGDSVGGNMAAVVALLAKERGGPMACTQLLFYPVTDGAMNTESYTAFADGPWLTKKAMQWFWDAYLPDHKKREHWMASPLHAQAHQMRTLPPALVITDENDVLRDEGEAYAQKLSEAGVDAVCVRVNGTVHDFVMLDGLADTAPAKAALQLAVAHLKKALM